MTASTNSNARILAGECFCGAVRYAVADVFEYALNCHCSNCRRTTGSAFKPFAGIARDKLSITSGERQCDDLWRRVPATTRIAGGAARCCIPWCATALTPMSRWARWSMIPRSARTPISSLAPRRPGSRSPTTCRNIKGTSREVADRASAIIRTVYSDRACGDIDHQARPARC